jgi:hypothetical protein
LGDILCSSRVGLCWFCTEMSCYASVLARSLLCLGPDSSGDWAFLFGLV